MDDLLTLELWKDGNDDFSKVDLDGPGIDFIKSKLTLGLYLARSVLAQTPLSEFTCFTYLPAYVKRDEAYSFDAGGKIHPRSQPTLVMQEGKRWFKQKAEDSDDILQRIIQEFLSQSSTNICVIEDASAEPTYPYLEKHGARVFFHSREVYHVLTSSVSPNDIRNALNLSSAWLRLGFLIRDFPIDVHLLLGREVELAWIASLVSHVTGVFVNAYDGESNVIGLSTVDTVISVNPYAKPRIT